VPERDGGLEEFEVAPAEDAVGIGAVAIGATGRTITGEVVAGDGIAGGGACVSVVATAVLAVVTGFGCAGGLGIGWLAIFESDPGFADVKAEGPAPQNVTSRLMLSSWQARCVSVSFGSWNAVEQPASAQIAPRPSQDPAVPKALVVPPKNSKAVGTLKVCGVIKDKSTEGPQPGQVGLLMFISSKVHFSPFKSHPVLRYAIVDCKEP